MAVRAGRAELGDRSRVRWVAVVAAAVLATGCVGVGDDQGDESSDEPSGESTSEVTQEEPAESSEESFEDASSELTAEDASSELTAEESSEASADASTEGSAAEEPSDEEPTEEASDDSAEQGSEPVGLKSLCVDIQHQPPPGQEDSAASGIWVRGEVYGLDGGWIWVEGAAFNNGERVEIEIEDGAFEGPLGINAYGNHEFDRFDLVGEDGAEPIDLLPTLAGGPGSVVPVGPDEGPAFDDECFDFDLLDLLDDFADDTSDEADTVDLSIVRIGLDDFVAAHVAGDTDALLATLHPAVSEGYGAEVCETYVADTTGSLAAVDVLDVGEPTTFVFETPNGTFELPDAVPFSAEFTTPGGDVISNDGHLVIVDDMPMWLTRCGVDAP